MGDSTNNIYFSGGSSSIPRSRQRAISDDHNIIPHLLACESQFHPYLAAGENPQNISAQLTYSRASQDTTQPDSDILQRQLAFGEGSSSTSAVAYPESSQRTTSHTLSPYATEASFADYSCDLTMLHASQTFRRGSWPSPLQAGYTLWAHSSQRVPRSPISEPPESTSDESYQDSDLEEPTQMSPMMNQFQIQSSRNVDLPQQHMCHAQGLQPSVMTFQLSETVLQRVDDSGNGMALCGPPDMRNVADKSELANPGPPSAFQVPFSASSRSQGPNMRLRHPSERTTQTSQFRVPLTSSNSIAFPSVHSHTNSRAGDQRQSGSKQQKKSKMHQCEQCGKMFPRPSGLATHMNTHSGARPFKCTVPNCEKSFAVRSNAKRHLRTHGINPSSPDVVSRPRFTVGFEEPMVTQVHDAGRQPSRYRWIPHNPSIRENDWLRQVPSPPTMDVSPHSAVSFQASMSSTSSSSLSNGSDDCYDEQASSGANDTQLPYGDYNNRETDGFPGTYPFYREHSQRGQ